MRRSFTLTILVGAGIGLCGCQSPGLGGLALWNRNNSSVAGDMQRPIGQPHAGTAPLGGARPASNDGFLMASWKKTTTALTGGNTKPKAVAPEDDPLRLDRMPKKIGPEVYVGAARLLENQGHFADAESKYREALRAAPTDLNALVGLARLYDRQGESAKAIDVYAKAAQAHPTSGLVFNDMGICYRRRQQLDKSLLSFRKAVDLQPDNAKYRNNLAGALVDAGRGDEALHELSVMNSPAVAHYNVAYLLQQKGLKNDAIRHLEQCIALEPTLTPARDMLAQLGGEPPAAAVSAQPAPRTTDHARSSEAIAPYSAGAAEQGIYTSAPQVESPAPAQPKSYRLSDDNGPAAETAQRNNWNSAAWALPPVDPPSGSQPLPPVE